MVGALTRASGKDTHPADGHHVVAYQHSSHKLGLDALSQQDLLEVRQAGLVDEHRLMTWDLWGGGGDGGVGGWGGQGQQLVRYGAA